jgi:hypothetical protein
MTDVEFEVPGALVRVAKVVQNSVTVVRVEIVVVEVVFLWLTSPNRKPAPALSVMTTASRAATVPLFKPSQ